MNRKELGIYIHIPFCKKKCYYCDFISFATNQNKVEEYFEAIEKEIDAYDFSKYKITTIYIGGGTPSYVDCSYICRIINKLKQKIEMETKLNFKDIEVTIEVNPGTVDREKIRRYVEIGINRISIGLQAVQDRLLKEIGRIHTFKEFLDSYRIIEEEGMKNINVDLMLGLPNQTILDLKESVEQIIKLDPSHISVYSLIVEEGTVISKLLDNGTLELPSEDLERDMYWYVKNKLELNGYNHYEISNFAKKGKESKHNMNCWNQKEYIGLGLAAHSYLNSTRYSNVETIDEYIENMKKIRDAEMEIEKEDSLYEIHEKQKKLDKEKEYMIIGLRKIDGIEINKFKEKFVDNPIFLFRKELDKLTKEELIVVDGNNIRLSNKGLDFANEVWEEFI